MGSECKHVSCSVVPTSSAPVQSLDAISRLQWRVCGLAGRNFTSAPASSLRRQAQSPCSPPRPVRNLHAGVIFALRSAPCATTKRATYAAARVLEPFPRMPIHAPLCRSYAVVLMPPRSHAGACVTANVLDALPLDILVTSPFLGLYY
jgi:hypothetical protein